MDNNRTTQSVIADDQKATTPCCCVRNNAQLHGDEKQHACVDANPIGTEHIQFEGYHIAVFTCQQTTPFPPQKTKQTN